MQCRRAHPEEATPAPLGERCTAPGHAIWLPELFPTYVRATSLSFCNSTGRIITGFGPLVAGLLAGAFGGNFNLACAVMTFFATLSLLAVLIGPETRHQQLPE